MHEGKANVTKVLVSLFAIFSHIHGAIAKRADIFTQQNLPCVYMILCVHVRVSDTAV